MARGKWATTVLAVSPPRTLTAAATTKPSTTRGTRRRFTRSMSAAHLRDRREVRDPRVEPGAGAERVGEDAVERRHQPQAAVEVVLVLVEHGDDVLQVREGGREVLARLADQRGQLPRQGRGGHEQVVHGV